MLGFGKKKEKKCNCREYIPVRIEDDLTEDEIDRMSFITQKNFDQWESDVNYNNLSPYPGDLMCPACGTLHRQFSSRVRAHIKGYDCAVAKAKAQGVEVRLPYPIKKHYPEYCG